MRNLIGVPVGGMIKDEEEVFLCFDWVKKDNPLGLVVKELGL